MARTRGKTCSNCGETLRRCTHGDDCVLSGWRHADGFHECTPRLGGTQFTTAEPALSAVSG